MKEKVRWAVILILYLIGVGIFAIPDLNNLANKIENIRVYETFQENVQDASGETSDVDPEEDDRHGNAGNVNDSGTLKADTERFTRLYEQMTAYNEQIFQDKQKDLCDSWSYEQSSCSDDRDSANGCETSDISRGNNGEYGSWCGSTWSDFFAGGRRKYKLCDCGAQRISRNTHVPGNRETSTRG